jgi:hypothetical protein
VYGELFFIDKFDFSFIIGITYDLTLNLCDNFYRVDTSIKFH